MLREILREYFALSLPGRKDCKPNYKSDDDEEAYHREIKINDLMVMEKEIGK